MSVVTFKPKEPDSPHVSGEAKCIGCQYVWVAVMPFAKDCSEATLAWLECPSCTLLKGRFLNYLSKDMDRWNCLCGNDLFTITKQGTYCPNCGDWQSF